MKHVYIIVKSAIYDHGIHAVSFDEKKAILLCDKAASNDVDDHHDWFVYRVPVDKVSVNVKPYGYHEGYNEDDPIYTTKKQI